ncbi:MAG: 6,7-dimethyl-8-ribityllumazine synthase [Candidatus Thorarchaeota archaeon]
MSQEIKIGIVVSEFNADITYLMLQVAETHAEFLGAEIAEVTKVPGAFDMPLAIKKLLERADIQGVATLGAVIQGDTKHDEVVTAQTSRLIADLSLKHGKPVSLGVIGPGATHAQAKQRIEEYARRSVESVVKMIKRTQ